MDALEALAGSYVRIENGAEIIPCTDSICVFCDVQLFPFNPDPLVFDV